MYITVVFQIILFHFLLSNSICKQITTKLIDPFWIGKPSGDCKILQLSTHNNLSTHFGSSDMVGSMMI